ncbi:hypothetical protein CTI12_AA089000 [Artemisia annua]|uniref:DNA-directed RNA polymerase C-terminal domain-containing protein n=1 Tax=Artemisia annua TaxID=35608 RepID=A0A2U1Q0S9_ARTAN|nr:hypothetical protein CTI12_AA089000 [Artemisia annua]
MFGTSDLHMPTKTRHVAKRIRTTPTSALGTTGTPTCATADARIGQPDEYRAFRPCNCICSSCQPRFWLIRPLQFLLMVLRYLKQMGGSCNGLQRYAALVRDSWSGVAAKL